MTPQEQARDARLRRLYGITSSDYDVILAWQNGRCAGCGTLPKSRRLHVDHDHKTGEVRGLLCFPCNSGLRRSASIEKMYRMIAYLEHHPARAALGRQPVGVVGRTTNKRRRRRRAPRRG